MLILRKRLKNTKKNKDKLAKLPKIYLVACWARYGVLEFPFSGRYKKINKKPVPLVWDFDDHNGTYPEYVLRPITWTTTAAIRGWLRDEQQAKDTAEFCEKRRLQAQQELRRKKLPDFREFIQYHQRKTSIITEDEEQWKPEMNKL